MGSSESGGNGLVDSSIGTIVWVRRRNGSWWPGKILGAEELSASHLMSPRSGTPVKLLGREDASVDWYNLEKSKRVKSFRCGEFDDCIERAEASLGLPSKKREKYARREDAILHALELEKEMLEKKYGKSGVKSSIKNNSCGSAGKDLRTSSGASKNGNGRHEIIELPQFHKVVSPTEDECNSNPLSAHKGIGAWQSSANSEYNPLIGALQDFTMPKKVGSAALSPLHKATSDDQPQAVSSGGVYFGGRGGVGAGISTDKGKGLLDGSVEESCIRRRDRRRPLVQVLHNTAMWPGHSLQSDGDTFSMSGMNHLRDDVQVKKRRLAYLPSQPIDMMDIKVDSISQMENFASHQGAVNHSHPNSFAKDATSGSSEDTESDSDSAETDSMEHYMNADMATYSDVNTPMPVQSRALNSVEMQGGQASTSSEESDESFLHDTLHFHRKNPVSLDMGVTRWLLKGKRNVRSFPRRSTDKLSHGTYLEPRPLAQRPSHSLSYYHDRDGYNNEVDFIENDSKPHMEGYGSRGHVWNSQAAPRRCNVTGSSMSDWEELTWRDRGYWGDRFGGFNSTYGGLPGEELLLDVDLKVQANHRREHVPFVSLMSRLNGKPIIGHPIQIETLGDGSTDALVSSSDAFENFESDDGNRVPPVWTTSRRTTSFQVPRPHLSSQMDDIDSQYADQDPKSQSRKPVSGNTYAKKNNSARMPKRKSPHVPKHPSKKPPKRSNSSSSQKIRPLSSIGMDQNLVSEPRHSGLISYMDGVIKPLDSGPPIVACIPVKLVFSRLLEAIGRPPSMPSSHNGFVEQQ